jgi:UDP-N-acetylglucosamine 2-epimerase (non-hydrolysing)/GDP/UDP-N,N'-diacetylbacillosamine 2-epimerase (hydrolysing)
MTQALNRRRIGVVTGTRADYGGDRQRGRLRGDSVIDCGESTKAIASAIETALASTLRTTASGLLSPYSRGNVSARIKDVLKTCDLAGLLFKRWHGDPV